MNPNQALQELKKGKKLTPYPIPNLKKYVDVCKNPTYEKLINVWKYLLLVESKTCIVTFRMEPWTLKFKKVSENKRVSNSGPSGLCNNFYLSTLEHEPEANGLWTFTQTRTYAGQEDELCKDFKVGKTITWDWRDDIKEMNCQFIEYGF
jgi:hypothetical protein